MKSIMSDGDIIAVLVERLIQLRWHVRSDATSCNEAHLYCAIARANLARSLIDIERVFDPFLRRCLTSYSVRFKEGLLSDWAV